MTGKVLNDLQVEMEMEIAMLREQNEMLRAAMANGKGNGIKVNALGTKNKDGVPYKGTVSVRVGRHSVVLYPSQWQDLLGKKEEILQTIEENKALLSWKE